MPVEKLCYIYPSPGKEARCKELIEWIVGEVKSKEPDVLRYVFHATDGADGSKTDFIAYISAKSEEALAKRSDMKHHKELAQKLKEEGLLRKPLSYANLERFCGFDHH